MQVSKQYSPLFAKTISLKFETFYVARHAGYYCCM